MFLERVVSRFLVGLGFSFVMFSSFQSDAQHENLLLTKIQLKKGTTRLDSAMLQVKKQTKVVFSFNPKRLATWQKIYINPTVKTLADFIGLLKTETRVSVKLIENYIVIGSPPKTSTKTAVDDAPIITVTQKKIIEKEKEQVVHAKAVTEPLLVKDSIKNEITSDNTRVKDSVIVLVDTLTTLGSDSLKSQKPSSRMPGDSIQFDKVVVSAPSLADTIKKVEPKPKKTKKKINPFLKFGVGADDSSILGAGIQVGIPIFYATLTGNSNFRASHFRYGAGTSFMLNSNMRFHVVANTGYVNREGHFIDVYGDRYSIAVESKLHRAGSGLEFRMPNKFSIQVLLQYNYLTNKYFIDGEPSNLEQFNNTGDEIFYTIKPLYVITDTFSPTSSSNIKTWMGLQLNLFYRIDFSNRGTR